MNDKDKQILERKFGNLMVRRVIVVNLLKSYDKELKGIDKEINDLVDSYTGVKEDGSTVQQEK